MKNKRRTTYLERRAGAGIGGHTTRMVRGAHQASTMPREVQVAKGLADVDRIKKRATEAVAAKALLNRAKKLRGENG